VNKYYFNCREGDHVTHDRVGMYLPNLNAAHAEAVTTLRELQFVAKVAKEPLEDCEIEVTDASGETVLSIPFEEGFSLR
jgi:hypothetical protein